MDKEQNGFDPKAAIAAMSSSPGVYRMLDAGGDVIYVGKARNLKKRVASYFNRGNGSAKTRSLVDQVRRIEVTVTHTETEALILEHNLIKELQPRYNVLLRDDKSYPFILLSQAEFPRLSVHRGPKREKGRYFGPYPSAGSVRDNLDLLQKLFRIRQCEDSFFRNRSRPCLQYQIKRCTAPCVGLVDREGYRLDVQHAVMFLEGKNNQVIDELVDKMEQASADLAYERAALYRDQIASLRRLQERQYVSREGGDADIIVAALGNGVGCIDIVMIRDGNNLGDRAFFPRHPANTDEQELLRAFLTQHYLGKPVPAEIIVSHKLEDREVIAEVLSHASGRRVRIRDGVRGERARWLQLAHDNARQQLARYLSGKDNLSQRFVALQELLELDGLPQRLECFDISHTAGEATVASCVVFDTNGPAKGEYRRFNISDVTPGDDYAAMHQALLRRYLRLKKGEGRLPEVLIIDGGKGQVAEAIKVLEELQITEVLVLGAAKGRARKPGQETLVLGREARTIRPAPDSPGLHLIQQIRDEAHRFALAGHRHRRARSRQTSPLEGITGIGPQRRRQLLRQFGGLQGIARAGIEDLAKLHGINRQLAQRIYDTFHGEE